MANKYDIFISYRRDDGQQYARLIEKELKGRGYRVFLDYEELDKGLFDEKIVHAITSSKIFVVVLTPLYLSRCNKAEDWVRKEIQLAISQGKEFVPIVPDNVFKEIPEEQKVGLPSDIQATIERVQRTEVSMGQMMKPSFDYLCKHRLRPFVRPRLQLKGWMTGIVSILLIIFVGGYFFEVYTEGKAEQRRKDMMAHLEQKYAPYGLNFYNNDTISIAQMVAIDDILGNMQDVRPDTLKMGIFEVTVRQWNDIMELPYDTSESLLPKTNVSHGDCLFYVENLCALTNIGFELPLEEDWEYAARGGDNPDGTIYSGGDNPDEVAWYKKNSDGKAHKCDGGNIKENGNGLFNMSGNVAELCYDTYDKGSADGKALSQKVVRGGHFASPAEDVTVTSRTYIDENDRSSNKVGLRLAIRLNK